MFILHVFLSQEIKKKLEILQQENHRKHDLLLVCILSHGAKGFVLGTDMQQVNIEEEICYLFDGDSCPQLLGKPKIFIIQACQGGKIHVNELLKSQVFKCLQGRSVTKIRGGTKAKISTVPLFVKCKAALEELPRVPPWLFYAKRLKIDYFTRAPC